MTTAQRSTRKRPVKLLFPDDPRWDERWTLPASELDRASSTPGQKGGSQSVGVVQK